MHQPGTITREASPDEQSLLAETRRFASAPFDARPVLTATESDLDVRLFRTTYLPAFVAVESLEENQRPVEADLAWLRLTTPGGMPTALGVLAVGKDPSAHVPGAYVQFIRYQGTDLDAPVVDQHELRGNLVGTATRLSALLASHLRTRLAEGTELFREEQLPDYPLEALREMCMNAIMHREYEVSHAPVRIAWFDDRIEVTNPGGPFGQVRADNFDRVNDYRNPGLARAMKALGYVNRFGRGIWRIRSAMARAGSPVPEFRIDDSSWSVVLRKWP
ncbi:TetR family transcriptional regulator [Amycolatopsis cynarae]|uniref:TetR family transcriptional regulator n=1 Tax=Amycolatopsis cynarae TaxID=2995223 RepID=A0ABY7B0D6_9PSEU|nr:ATP-binding protein [Amycolatopsis sp. HUAS 11-8]WAL64381.1 TetR family transcriptional regulator [Amycolatopsis sp. HUAS 11-8]